MADFTFADIVVSFIKTNMTVQPASSKYPVVIKFGQSANKDTRVAGGTASVNSGTWTVYPARYNKINSNYTNAMVQAIMDIDYKCSDQITEAVFLNAVEDIEQQFRENFVSSAKTVDYELTIQIFEVSRFATGTLRYTKWVDASS